MIYHAVETAYTILAANFDTDLATLGTANSVTVAATGTIGKRLSVEDMLQRGDTLPLLGVTALAAATNAKGQQKRDSVVTLVFDYYAKGTDVDALAAQTELAAEAMLLTIDRLWPTIKGGAGEVDGSVQIELSRALDPAEQDTYVRRATATFTATDRDDGL